MLVEEILYIKVPKKLKIKKKEVLAQKRQKKFFSSKSSVAWYKTMVRCHLKSIFFAPTWGGGQGRLELSGLVEKWSFWWRGEGWLALNCQEVEPFFKTFIDPSRLTYKVPLFKHIAKGYKEKI